MNCVLNTVALTIYHFFSKMLLLISLQQSAIDFPVETVCCWHFHWQNFFFNILKQWKTFKFIQLILYVTQFHYMSSLIAKQFKRNLCSYDYFSLKRNNLELNLFCWNKLLKIYSIVYWKVKKKLYLISILRNLSIF